MSLFPENQAGIIWTMVCLAILTFTAVFLSVVMDQRFKYSKSKASIQSRVEALQVEISAKRSGVDFARNRLLEAELAAGNSGRSLARISSELARLQADVARQSARGRELSASIAAMQSDFAAYREKYRAHAWGSANGEKIGRLLTKSGRQYDNVIITSVTPMGLTISHASGNARIPSDELDIEFHRRFQWTDEMRPVRMLPREPETVAAVPERAHTPHRPRESKPPDSELIELKARELVLARSLVTRARTEHQRAVAQSGHRTQRSVPGSLRTWPEQARILEVQLQRASTREAMAREELRTLSPSHPLLRSQVGAYPD